MIGFNELNVVVMDPKTGSVYKVGMNDATNMFDTPAELQDRLKTNCKV